MIFIGEHIKENNFPLDYRITVIIINNAIGVASSRGRYFEFSSANAENSLVPLPTGQSGSVPTMHIYDKTVGYLQAGSLSK